jgi:uncharacterized damage-inducible protein DinB
MERTYWFDRKFNFDDAENSFSETLGRLSKTPIRLTDLVRTIPEEWLTLRLDGKWSIKENIGHLTDLEPLWQQRLKDIISGAPEMHEADLSNTKTNEANHNSKHISELLNEFETLRNQTLSMLEEIDEEIKAKSSLHPRLKTPMRTTDLFLFVAEHDEHHLETISLIAERLFSIV